MEQAIITLTSDFGPGPFAGVMKGVMLAICPGAALVDLSHAVPAQDVRSGAQVLEQALGVFPEGTVHLAVVDPGVGTERRALCLAAAGCLWVGPDNGLFTPMLLADPGALAWSIEDPGLMRRPVSATFHGRDIFAPAAAHLAAGLAPERVGPPLPEPLRLEWPRPGERDGALKGAVLGTDHFGNLATNLDRERVEGFLAGRPALVRLAGLSVAGIAGAYGRAAPGEPVVVYNSLDRLELAENQGDLCRRLGLERGGVFGLEVVVEPAG